MERNTVLRRTAHAVRGCGLAATLLIAFALAPAGASAHAIGCNSGVAACDVGALPTPRSIDVSEAPPGWWNPPRWGHTPVWEPPVWRLPTWSYVPSWKYSPDWNDDWNHGRKNRPVTAMPEPSAAVVFAVGLLVSAPAIERRRTPRDRGTA